MPAATAARSTPPPMAMPTSHCARAGESFRPSPTMHTARPRACMPATAARLSAGSARPTARTAGTPACPATASTTCCASPLTIQQSSPRAPIAATTDAASGRTRSVSENTPAPAPSTQHHTSASQGSRSSRGGTAGGPAPSTITHSQLPARTARPATVQATPFPGTQRTEVATGTLAALRSQHDARNDTSAFAMGCSDASSQASTLVRKAAGGGGVADSTRCECTYTAPESGGNTAMSLTAMFPCVRVPVLSNTSVRTDASAWNAPACLTSTPWRAAMDAATSITGDTASAKAQGHEMASTVMESLSANANGLESPVDTAPDSPSASHATNTATARANRAGTNTAATRSAAP
mmetsp:Transcript_660/g.1530  ORF Transcript_660/g.1530 Transcript_660/m.1530 type:complete len:352 (+) Transcript_660:449-1504(+)